MLAADYQLLWEAIQSPFCNIVMISMAHDKLKHHLSHFCRKMLTRAPCRRSLATLFFLLLTCHVMEAAVSNPDKASHLPCDLSAKMCRALPSDDPKFQEQCYVEVNVVSFSSTIRDCASACRPGVDNRHKCRFYCSSKSIYTFIISFYVNALSVCITEVDKLRAHFQIFGWSTCLW